MSEHLRPVCLAALLALAPVTTFAETSDCEPLPSSFVLCAQDTEWNSAVRTDLGEGVIFQSGERWLEIFDMSEHFPPSIRIEEVLDQIEAEFAQEAASLDLDEPVTLAREHFHTEHLEVVSLTNRAEVDAGEVESFVIMVAEADGKRISIAIDPGEDIDPDSLFAATRAVTSLIRPASGG